jgi:hypothetical protein
VNGKGRKFILPLVAFLFFVAQSVEKVGKWKGSIDTENGVTVIKNPQQALFDEDIIEFKEELVIREGNLGNSFVFWGLTSLLLDERGNIYIMDSKEANIKVFDGRGRFLRTIGKKGQGPGELEVPESMDLFHQNQIAVYDPGNRRLNFFDLEGDFKRSLSTAKLYMSSIRIDSRGDIFGLVSTSGNGLPRYELQKWDSDLNHLKTFDGAYMPVESYLHLFAAMPSFALSKGNLIYYGYPEQYEIKVFDDSGTLIKKIKKDNRAARIPQREIDLAIDKVPPTLKVVVPSYYAPYYRVYADDEGRLIVLTRYRLGTNRAYDYDVFSPDGTFLTTTTLRTDRWAWRKNKLYAIEAEQDGSSVLRIYDVVWKTKK